MKHESALLGASAAFAGAAVFGSAVAIRHDVPGEPFGLRIGLPVRSGLLVGWGAGVAAPWAMPVAALMAAATAGRSRASAAPGFICAGLGLGCIAGTLIEPVTYRRRSWGPATRMAIVINVVASAVLTAAGLRYAGVRLRAHTGD